MVLRTPTCHLIGARTSECPIIGYPRDYVVVSIAGGRQNVKMDPFDVVANCFNVISNCGRVIMFRKGLEMLMLRFPFVKSSLRFLNIKIAAVPATSFVNDFG